MSAPTAFDNVETEQSPKQTRIDIVCRECSSPTDLESPLCGRCRSSMYRMGMAKGVYFKPWVGRQYGPASRWRIPVLIVGESHYEWLPERWRNGDLMPVTTTQKMVEEISQEAYRHAHWTKIAIALTGENPWPRSADGPMGHFWHSVAYYNYIQEGVGLDNGQQPTAEMFSQSSEGFTSVLADLAPGLVIIFSFRVWNAIAPLLGSSGTVINSVGDLGYYGKFENQACSSVVLAVPHPRAPAFRNARNWHSTICQFIDRVASCERGTSQGE